MKADRIGNQCTECLKPGSIAAPGYPESEVSTRPVLFGKMCFCPGYLLFSPEFRIAGQAILDSAAYYGPGIYDTVSFRHYLAVYGSRLGLAGCPVVFRSLSERIILPESR